MSGSKKVAAVAAALGCASVAAAGTTADVSLGRSALPFRLPQHAAFLSAVRGGGDGGDSDHPDHSNQNADSATDSKPSGKKKKKRRSYKFKKQDTETTTESTEKEAPPPPPTQQEALVQELLRKEDYYDILGVPKTATPQQIQKAYRRRAVQTHPDKMPTGDRRAFDKVAEAHDVLSDDQKRGLYDRFGKRGLDPTAAGHGAAASGFHSAEEIFRSFFGGNAPFRSSSSSGPPRNRTARYQLEVSLADLYRGLTRTVQVTGHRKKRVEVHVPRGMASGQSILLSGAVDDIPNATPADLIFVLVQRPHPTFTRRGHDLAMEIKISLREAVCGVTRTIRHLDGRSIAFSSAHHHHQHHQRHNYRHDHHDGGDGAPVVIQTGDVQVLKGEGMPKPPRRGHEEDDTSEFGDLYVQFVVEMPSPNATKHLSSEERLELERLLSKLEGSAASKEGSHEKDVVYLEKASTSDFGRASGHFQMEQDDIPLDEGERSFPFGGAGRHFYWSSSGTGGSPFSFGGSPGGPDDDENAQCQQM